MLDLFGHNTRSAQEITTVSASALLIPNNREDIHRLVWGNGGNRPPTIEFHEDGGHGWLQVPHKLLKALQIDKKISSHSFRDSAYAYLEEDEDLSTFVVALQMPAKGLMKLFWEVCPKDYKEDSPIRSKARY